MRKVIDLECDLPPDEDGNPRTLEAATHPPGYGDPERLAPLKGHGFSNYARIFTRRGEGGEAESGPQKKHGMSIADFVRVIGPARGQGGVFRARLASPALLWGERVRLGAVPAIRQHIAAGQNHGRPVLGGVRHSDGSGDRGIRRAAAESVRARQVALQERPTLLPSGLTARSATR